MKQPVLRLILRPFVMGAVLLFLAVGLASMGLVSCSHNSLETKAEGTEPETESLLEDFPVEVAGETKQSFSIDTTDTTAPTPKTTATTTATNQNPTSLPDCSPTSIINSGLNDSTLVTWRDTVGVSGEKRQLLAEFTTCYEPGEDRVTNIEKIADLTRGVSIAPSQTFSLNNHIGQRTIENGFVAADALSTTEGLFPSVGGGISQFTTALFNAAFFAGLDITESQAHTYHFPRYPNGREATINWSPPIDLKIRNNTTDDILIWTSYLPDRTSVFIFGVPAAVVEELPQEKVTHLSNCAKVTTTRKRTFNDGTMATDKFVAIYQDALGEPCR